MSNSTAEGSHRHFPNIDGLRGLAALMVLTFHLFNWIDGTSYIAGIHFHIEHLSRGVQLFFILSAFTLFHTAHSRWPRSQHPVWAFYIRRIFRIIPLWWLVIFYEVFRFAEPLTLEAIFSSAFLTFGLRPDKMNLLIIPVGWTLFVEESFYVFFPLWRVLLRNWIMAALILVASTVLAYHTLRYGLFGLRDPDIMKFVSTSPLTNYYAFFLGILLERLIHSRGFAWFCSSRAAPKLILNGLTIGCAAFLFFAGRLWGTFLLVPLFVASFNPETLFGALMRNRFMTHFGRYCYSIYLFHPYIGSYMANMAKQFVWPTLHLTALPTEIKLLLLLPPVSLACLGFGLLSYHVIELPSIALGKALVRRLGTNSPHAVIVNEKIEEAAL